MCVAQVFAKVGKLLSDGRQFLCAGHFTAADLAFAALAYPVLMPQPAFAYLLPPLEEFPAEVRTAVELRRETAAGKFAMRLYRQHRFPRASNMHCRVPNGRWARRLCWHTFFRRCPCQ